MKKFLLILILGIPMLSNAQDFRFGIIAEPSISWFKTDVPKKIAGNGSKLGINIGLLADNYFAEHYAFSTGISLHSMGGRLQYMNGTVLNSSDGIDTVKAGNTVQYNLQYLHIPFALKFKTTEIGYFTFFAHLGLDAMINIKTRAKVIEQDISDVSVSEEINLFNFAYHIGAGIEYKIVGNTSLMAGFTYMNGFADITDDPADRALMHCVSINLGVIF
jgi:opacity protein-like surface antigen